MATTRASVKRNKIDKKELSLGTQKKISNVSLNNSYIILQHDSSTDNSETKKEEPSHIISNLRDKLAYSENENLLLKQTNENLNSKIDKLQRELNILKSEIEKQNSFINSFTNSQNSELQSVSTQTETDLHIRTSENNLCKQNKVLNKKILLLGDSHCRHYSKLLRNHLDDGTETFGITKPNAKVNVLAQDIENECKSFTQNDYVIFMGGTNDLDNCYNSENIIRRIRS